MKVARRPCFSAIDFTMNLKNEWRSAVTRRVVEVPVHLELAVGVLVVVLVRAPAQLQHVVADLADDVVAAHQGLLVVARLGGVVLVVRDRAPSGQMRKYSHSTPVLTKRPWSVACFEHVLQDDARRLGDVLVLHDAVGGDPGDLLLPGQLDERRRVGHAEQIRVRRRHVEVGGEAREPGAVLLHVGDRRGRNELGALAAEQVRVGDHEVADAALFRDLRESCDPGEPVLCHRCFPNRGGVGALRGRSKLRKQTQTHSPQILKIALARNPARTGERHARHRGGLDGESAEILGLEIVHVVVPQARAMVCASSVITFR